MPEPREEEERPNEERPAIHELIGESEHSVEEAHIDERAASRRMARGPATRGADEPDVEDLGRRSLEEATEAPVERTREESAPLRGPID
jgi:hypothetical protein